MKKLSDNEREALWSSIAEAMLKYERMPEPVEAEDLFPELVRDAEVRRCLGAFRALEVAVNLLDRRVARILGARAKTMGKTFEEAYPEIDWKRLERRKKSA